MNKYALHTNTYHGFSLAQAIASASAAGFPSLEIAAVKGWTEHLMPDMANETIERAIYEIQNHGLDVPVLSAHGDLRSQDRQKDFLASVQLAKRLGCHTIVTSSGEAHFGTEVADEERLLEGIRRVLAACEAAEIELAIETHGSYGSGAKLMELIVHINSPLLGIAYDTANVTRHGGVLPQEDIRICAERVKHVHLKDKSGAFDSRTFTALGEGWIDFPEVFSALDKVKYSGLYSVEIEYFEAAPPEKARIDHDVAASFQYLVKAGRI